MYHEIKFTLAIGELAPSWTGVHLLHNRMYKNFVVKLKQAQLKLLVLANRFIVIIILSSNVAQWITCKLMLVC